MVVLLRRILKGCHVGKDSQGLLCEKDCESLSAEKNSRCRHVRKNLSSCSGGNNSEWRPCQKVSEGFCVVKNLRGCGVQEDSEIVSC